MFLKCPELGPPILQDIILHVGLASCQCTKFMKKCSKIFSLIYTGLLFTSLFYYIEHVEISKLEEDIFKKKQQYIFHVHFTSHGNSHGHDMCMKCNLHAINFCIFLEMVCNGLQNTFRHYILMIYVGD